MALMERATTRKSRELEAGTLQATAFSMTLSSQLFGESVKLIIGKTYRAQVQGV